MPTIRVPTASDAVDLTNVIVELVELSNYDVPPEWEYIYHSIIAGLDNQWWFCRIAEHEDAIVGFVIGCVAPLLWAKRYQATMQTIYVAEKTPFRLSTAVKLAAEFTDWAKNTHNARVIVAGETSGISPRRARTFFHKCGYREVGTVYHYKETVR